MQPDSPAALLFSYNASDVWPWLLRVALPPTLIAFLVAMTMGQMALLLTAVVAGATVLGWILRRNFNLPPTFLHALVTIALPWFLVSWRHGVTPEDEGWLRIFVLFALWTLHHWGEGRVICFEEDWIGVGLLIAADLGIIGLLVLLQLPIWVVLMVLIALPTWISLLRRLAPQPLVFWWWLGMLISAFAVSQT